MEILLFFEFVRFKKRIHRTYFSSSFFIGERNRQTFAGDLFRTDMQAL